SRRRHTRFSRDWSSDVCSSDLVAAGAKHVMDCVDCHNRPTHIYPSPDRSVDRAISAGKIDPTLPYIKQQAVTILARDYKSADERSEERRVGKEWRSRCIM